MDSADANDDGRVDISDGVFDLGFLFLGGDAPAAPFPDCGRDPTDDDVDCGSFAFCEGPDELIAVFGRVLFDTGEPVEGATITVSAVDEESIARVAAVLVENEDGKTVRTKKHERLRDRGRAGDRVALGIIDSVQTTTDDAGLYQADVQVFDSTGLLATYAPPDGGAAGRGANDWWTVFSIDGETGGITEINTLGADPAPYADTDMGCLEPIEEGDTCVEAVEPSPCPWLFVGSTSGAVSDGSASCGASTDSPDAWFRYTASESGSLEVDLCGSSYDTVLSVHSGCPGTGDNELACNDDFCGAQSAVSFAATGGETYLIRVSGFGGASGDFRLNIGCAE